MTDDRSYENAVLDDLELQAALKGINPKFGDFVTRVAGEAWGLPLIDQKTKALIAIAVDVVSQDRRGPGNPFAAHVSMALKQGATREEIEELLLFMCVYAGFNQVAGCFGTLNEIYEQSSNVEPRKAAMISAIKKVDYALRDQNGKAVFYVLLWKRKSITLDLFDEYWRNVHGPVCARLPGQHQYWQFHLAHNQGGLWQTIDGIEYTSRSEDQFDGIAELTFETEADRQTWFQAAAILMDDEHNLFSKAIGYNTSPGNSKTYVDGIETGDPNGKQGILKFHVMVKKADAVSVDEFRKYMTDSFAASVVESDSVLKFRLHLFEFVDNSRKDADGVIHNEPLDKQYQAAFEIAFSNSLEMETFFASIEYAKAVKDLAKYVKQLLPFPERTAYTFVYDSKMTLAGQRSSKVADLIAKVGATNQLKSDIISLMSGKQNVKSGLGHYLQGVQHFGVTVQDMAKSLEFYTEVLGGKLVIAENGLVGDEMQNTLFQKEDLDAIALEVDLETFGVPNLRDAKEALDIKFISFGNACLELIYFRDAASPNAPNSSVRSIPSHIGHVNAMHLSFHVKDDVDLNVFANILEAECHKRGMTNVVFNRIIRVKSEEERRNIALKYNSYKFWDEPDLLAEGQPETDFGEFEGWALFYCKGPNGEQLEFNQVTRKVKEHFAKAQSEYNEANGTFFAVSDAKVSSPTTKQERAMLERIPGTATDMVKQLISRVEAFDYDGVIPFFTDTPVYQFGNFEVCLDKAAIKKAAEAFFSQISAVSHEIKMMWEVGNVVFAEMDVIYRRKYGSVISLPCCNVFRLEGDKFSELRIFMDVNPLFDPTIALPDTASVFTVSQGKKLTPPHIIQSFFAEHAEGKKRVETGFAPKGSINGHNSSISPLVKSTSKVDIVMEMEATGGEGNWDYFNTFFVEDVYFKVGASQEKRGTQGIRDYLTWLYAIAEPNLPFEFRGTWELEDVVIIEMNAKYIRRSDGKPVSFPCTDILRFQGNKIREWRVYPDQSELWMNEKVKHHGPRTYR